MPHETTIKSPGYALSVVQAVCTCGWRGPDRNAYDLLDRTRVQIDADAHRAAQLDARGLY